VGHREQKKERLRQEISDVALALFRERGFEQTRVQDVVERVGISEATFFNYFATKDAVLNEHAATYLHAYRELLEDELNRTELTVSDRLREIAEVLAASFSEDREFLAATVGRTGLFVGTSGALLDATNEAYERLGDLFQQGQGRGEIRDDLDSSQLAEIYTGIYIITITNWLTGWWPMGAQSLTDRLRAAVEVFLAGAVLEASP
jgi:AcrR family transcriptional regulator